MTERPHEICAWCWKAGRLTVLSPGTSPEAALMAVEDHEVSHGICLACRDEQKAVVEAWKISLAGKS